MAQLLLRTGHAPPDTNAHLLVAVTGSLRMTTDCLLDLCETPSPCSFGDLAHSNAEFFAILGIKLCVSLLCCKSWLSSWGTFHLKCQVPETTG